MTTTTGTAAAASPPVRPKPVTRGRAPVVRYRLLRRHGAAALAVPTEQQRRVIDHPRGRLRVLAGPGTGKTTTIVEAVADRILRRGLDPSTILVLTFSRRSAAELSQRIAARLGVTVSEPLVRTLHSYAYAVVRAAAADAGEPAPRLLDAGQADLMVREMLAGHADDGAPGWPPHLRQALRVPAFAAELREFMLRTVQRQISPREIAAAARRLHRPEWLAAAHFIGEYRDIADLRQATSRFGVALDQAELTTAALERLARPRMLAAQQAAVRRIFVDEYQDVDPAQADLVEMLASGADELVVVGDPDQSIYAFRGAASGALQRVRVDQTVALTTSHRMPPELLSATRRVAARLPGPVAHRELRPAPEVLGAGLPATLDVRVLADAGSEARYVADRLRRAHLEDGVAWSRMALVLRSPAGSAEPLRRACAAAGVPVAGETAEPLAVNPLVSALLSVLHAGVEPASLTAPSALALLASPLVGMDPLAVRRLRRAVRAEHRTRRGDTGPPREDAGSDRPESSADLLVEVLLQRRALPRELALDLAMPVRRLTDLIALAGESPDGQPAEDVLWRVWQRSGLADRLLADSERGGRNAASADLMLDAAVALFDRAARLADQLPGAGVRELVDLISGEQIPSPAAGRRSTDAVTILSAHAAKGLEWEVVAVPGVQQDTWPDLRPRASLLDLPALLDAVAGIDPHTPAASRLADERRLFYVATTRARRTLVVTAVQNDESEPSRFLAELAGTDVVPVGWPPNRDGQPRRALNLPALVAELRRAVTAPDMPGATGSTSSAAAHLAACELARLAAAGVPGADPGGWHGLAPLSTSEPLVPPGAELVLSPSQVESLLACPLRGVLERQGARGAPSQPQLLGIAVHALAQGMAAGATDADVAVAIDAFLAGQDRLPPWQIARLRRMVETMAQALRGWMRTRGAERELVGSEVPLQVRLPPRTDESAVGASHPVRLAGRADWVSRDSHGRIVVTDFKSGAVVPSRAAVAEHAQLAVYQLAAALGAFADPADGTGGARGAGSPGDDAPSAEFLGGAELVYLRSGRPKTLAQAPLDPGDQAGWVERLHDMADLVSGATLTARQGEACDRCPVRSSCPLQPEGRQVTR